LFLLQPLLPNLAPLLLHFCPEWEHTAAALQLLAVLLLDCPARPGLGALGEQAVEAYKAVVQVCHILNGVPPATH
jgi:hypothetical protein